MEGHRRVLAGVAVGPRAHHPPEPLARRAAAAAGGPPAPRERLACSAVLLLACASVCAVLHKTAIRVDLHSNLDTFSKACTLG